MTAIRSHDVVRILHFDDEVEAAAMIPEALYYTYKDKRESWIVKESVLRENTVTRFQLQPTVLALVEIEYRLVDDVDDFRKALAEVRQSESLLRHAIAICDLMRARSDSNKLEAIGFDLYREARDETRIPESRLFILSGFPNHFRDQHPQIHFPDTNVFRKPTPAPPVVDQLIRLFPEQVRV